jgi:hypothetical protein
LFLTQTNAPTSVREEEATQCAPLVLESSQASDACQPVTVGVPLPKGMLTPGVGVKLLGEGGLSVGCQSSPLAHWSDGSVKWLLLDFIVPPSGQGRSQWALELGGVPAQAGAERVSVRVLSDSVVVETGVATFTLPRSYLGPISRVQVGGEDVLDGGLTGTVLRDRSGKARRGKVEVVRQEASGPVRATICLEGEFAGSPRCRFVARLSFFAGSGLVRLDFTLHNPRRARHPGGLWDLGESGSLFIKEFGLELGLQGTTPPVVEWRAEPSQPLRSARGADLEIYQDSSGGENWQSKNHVNRHGQVPHSFRGYRVRVADGESFGTRATPSLSLRSEQLRLTVAVPEFWQQFPRAIEVAGRRVHLGLFPRQFNGDFELQGGEQKTHTVWLHFGKTEVGPHCLDWVHDPVRAHATPEWYAESGAIPYLTPAAEDSDGRLQGLLAGAFDGPNSFVAGQELIDEFGWRNYGDVYANHEAAHYPGPRPVISHYNNQYDVLYGSLLQYYRTGDIRWFQFLAPLARHIIDIDVYHTSEDKAAYNGGLFWHTDHYKDVATATHRAYSRANARGGRSSYGGGPGNTHNYATGLLHYYYATGDPGARDAVLSLADWVVNMDDGTRNILGWVDDGPSGLATHNGEPVYNGPGRGSGNSLNALLDGWLVSGRRTYLNKAEALIRRVIHPRDDVAARDLLNVEPRWSYTVFLSALARYLGVKAEMAELDFMYGYARASLLHYATWMLEHEVAYFDQVEKLEYPTETWAAQEFRKANVLRLAAAHAEPGLCPRLLERGHQFAERAWQDLGRFPSRTVTRALAILMIEGTKDAAFRTELPQPGPAPAGDFDFGDPQPFVYQKARVLARLKSVKGVLSIFVQLLDPRQWWRVRDWPL